MRAVVCVNVARGRREGAEHVKSRAIVEEFAEGQ